MSAAQESRDMKADPVTVQILRNRVGGLMEEMAHHFFRSGYSTIVRESRDFSCVIVDAKGRLIASPPMFYHATAYYYLAQKIIALYGGSGFADGDMFVANHPLRSLHAARARHGADGADPVRRRAGGIFRRHRPQGRHRRNGARLLVGTGGRALPGRPAHPAHAPL